MYSSFRDKWLWVQVQLQSLNIWGVDLADMQLFSKFNKGFRVLLCVIDIYCKYAWVVPLFK